MHGRHVPRHARDLLAQLRRLERLHAIAESRQLPLQRPRVRHRCRQRDVLILGKLLADAQRGFEQVLAGVAPEHCMQPHRRAGHKVAQVLLDEFDRQRFGYLNANIIKPAPTRVQLQPKRRELSSYSNFRQLLQVALEGVFN
jgi:hypothetical protein